MFKLKLGLLKGEKSRENIKHQKRIAFTALFEDRKNRRGLTPNAKIAETKKPRSLSAAKISEGSSLLQK